MAVIRQEAEASSIEAEILVGLIMNDRFCFEIEKSFRPEYIRSEYIGVVCGWVMRYFREQRSSPGRTIMRIYEVEKDGLSRAKRRIVFAMLSKLSRSYDEKSFNADYTLSKARDYFRQRSVEMLFERGDRLVSAGRHDEAQRLLDEYKQVSVDSSSRFSLFDRSSIVGWRKQGYENELFSFPGQLGQYLGPLSKGWLVSIAGPEKRGKTWWLMESAFQGAVNRIRTAFFSLEMNDYSVKTRFYKRLTGMITERELERIGRYRDYYRYPVFDCKANAAGKCKLRRGRGARLEGYDDYSPAVKYRVCEKCREGEDRSRWMVDYWFDYIDLKKVKTFKFGELLLRGSEFMGMYGKNLRVKTFSRFSASFSDIERELDDMEYSEGFSPQLIVVDYPDIMAPERGVSFAREERSIINATWMRAAQLAENRKCCVVVGDQTTRRSRETSNVRETDTPEDKRKDSHVDMKVVLNQSAQEHNHGVMRLYLMFHRHEEVVKNLQVMVTQMIRFGQPLLDSEYVWMNVDKKGGDATEDF